MANFFDQFDSPATAAPPPAAAVGPWTKYAAQTPQTPPAQGRPWEKYQTAPGAPQAAPQAPNYFDQFDAPASNASQPYPGPTGQPQASAVADEERSLVDTIMDGGAYGMGIADQGARGVANGVANIAGLPNAIQQGGLSALEWGLGKAGAPEAVLDTVGGFKNLVDVFPSAEGIKATLDSANNTTADVLGVERPRVSPDNFPERAASRIMEEVGAAAVPAGAALNKARAIGVQGARAMPGMIGRYVESAAVNPARFARREGAMALGAGAGAATANEAVDRDTTAGALADFFGAVTGAGTVGGGAALGRVMGDIGAAATGRPGFASNVVRDTVTDALIQNSDIMSRQVDPSNLTQPLDTQALIDAINRPSDAERLVPGLRASTADTAGDAGLASLENARSRANPGPYRDRVDHNAMRIEDVIMGMRPDERPGAYRSTAEAVREQLFAEAATGRQSAADAAAEAVRQITPADTAAQRGSMVREGLETARDAARARTDAAYAQANIAGRQVDPAPLTSALDVAVGGLTEVERGLVPQGVVDRVRGLGLPLENGPQPTGLLDAAGATITRPPRGPEPVALKEATDLKSELQRLQRAALADPRAEKGGRNAARVLGQMVDTVDGFIASNLDETDQAALSAARGAKFDEAERFTRQGDPVQSALARYEGGLPAVRDDRVAGLFTNTQAMDRLFAQADTPAVRDAIRNELLSRADTSTAAGVDRFMSANAEQIERFPGLGNELTRAAAARTAEAEAGTRFGSLERDLGTDTRPGRSTVGRYLQYSDANARKGIRDVMAAKDPGRAADELVNFVGNDKQAIDGLRAAFWDDLDASGRSANAAAETKGGTMPWIPRKMLNYLDDPAKAAVAERIYRDDPQHLAMIRELAGALKGVNTGQRIGNAVNPSGTAQMMRGQPPVSFAEISSKAYQAKIGRVGVPYVALHLAGKLARGVVQKQSTKAYELLLDRALTDRAAATALLAENNPANRAAITRMTKGWFGAEMAFAIGHLVSESKEADELKK
ncbi:hypothetical protein C8J36_104142 [Rhizobium sp. PP-F2F-G48]|uniref:hypothetical protein n=1 Tax=Rhizobium sp. PP-F2F-G48 TaxID=2135651 RepID=UPI001049A7BD|nr:hypothetical protein [Rhizobium sp. PP-F2F-G48]TCM54950.1 hypothetical protein C8J36_104142 [Rhizobium sp. PP-F2F-G48]